MRRGITEKEASILLIVAIVIGFVIGFGTGWYIGSGDPVLIKAVHDKSYILVECEKPVEALSPEEWQILKDYMDVISIPSFVWKPYGKEPTYDFFSAHYIFGTATPEKVEKIRRLKFVNQVYYIG